MPNQYTKKTFKDQYKEKGFDYWTALKRRDAGMTEDKIFFPGSLRNIRKTTPITIHNETYQNLKEAEEEQSHMPSDEEIAKYFESIEDAPQYTSEPPAWVL